MTDETPAVVVQAQGATAQASPPEPASEPDPEDSED